MKPTLRCKRENCSIRSHKHRDDNFAEFFGFNSALVSICDAKYKFNHPQSYYIRLYNKLMNSECDNEFVTESVRGILREDNYLSLFKAVFLYTLFSSSYNLRWFLFSLKPSSVALLYSNFENFCKESIPFSEMVRKFDIAQDFYERTSNFYMLAKPNNFWDKFKQKVDDADNIFTSEILSFL